MAAHINGQTTSSEFILNKKQHWLVTFVVFANLSTLYSEYALWFFLLAVICFGWRYGVIRASAEVVNRKKYKLLLASLAILGCVFLALNAPNLGLLSSMIHLLSFSYMMKMLEQNNRKDFYQLICIGLFILASSLIFNQSLALFLYFTFVFILNVALLLHYFSANISFRKSFKKSTMIILQSLPLAICLFLFFPKLSSFWQMPGAKSASTGLSDNVSIGDIAKLTLSNELAFRADFTENPPSYSQLYWRAITLANFDGKSWKKYSNAAMVEYSALFKKEATNNSHDKFSATKHTDSTKAGDNIPTRYQIITEPSNKHWLFGLAVTEINQVGISVKNDQTLYSNSLINEAVTYQATSYLSQEIEPDLSIADKNLNLDIPPGSNLRLAVEAQRLRAIHHDDNAFIDAVLQSFYQQDFHYTLQPPQLSGDVLDQFYFDTKKGFCEHYASTFTFMMRVGGIPARLTLGYMGGDYNSEGDFYSVRQKDAHAWSEVWLEGQGFVRIDPTGYVNPERVEQGFSEQLNFERSQLSGELFNYSKLLSFELINNIRSHLEKIDYQWTKWVVGFDSKKQFNLLASWFGEVKLWKTTAIIFVGFIFTIILIWVINLKKEAQVKKAKELTLYLKLLSKLEKKGLIKPKEMSVIGFSAHVAAQNKAMAKPFSSFSYSFNAICYGDLNQAQKDKIYAVMKLQYEQCILAFKS